MPIYEFVCDACGSRFEDLVPAGTETLACSACGSKSARRVFSPQAATPRLVKTRRDAGKQERRNADLQARSKQSFGEAVREAAPKAKRPKDDV